MGTVNNYDKKHLGNIEKYKSEIDAIYRQAAKEAAILSSGIKSEMKDKVFSFSDYPKTKKKIDNLLNTLYGQIKSVIVNGIRDEWELSNLKNDEFVKVNIGKSFSGKRGGKPVVLNSKRYFQNNESACEAFMVRKTNGLDLSERVWNYVEKFKNEIELGIDIGLRDGLSSSRMARDLRQYLKCPDKLFRRVRDEHGNLKLSKAAKAFHPGQGVYRSSYKNALRLAATETNMAYRTADYMRWQQLDFVVGIEIKLSNNHTLNGVPFTDICDELKGRYPKDFKFTGWHPHCRCYAITILKTEEEMERDTQRILDGKQPLKGSVNTVEDLPENFNAWLDRNRDRVKTTTSVPYFIKDNGKYIPKDWVDGIGSLAKGGNKGIIADVKEAIINMKDPTFVTEKEVRTMIEKYAEAEPGDFYGGLAGVKISKAEDGMMMSCERLYYKNSGAYASQNGNTIRIYKTDHSVIDPLGNTVVFNPLHEVKEAMKSIAAQIPLSFNQEYAIESLWHEIRHAGAVGWKDIRKQTEDLTAAMECINQFCARRSYGKFLRAIGGSVSHKKEIIKGGYGYNRSVRHFEEMLAALNVSSSEAYAHFSKMIMVEPYENIFGGIVKFLVKKGVDGQKAEMLIKTLRRSDDMFRKVIMGV